MSHRFTAAAFGDHVAFDDLQGGSMLHGVVIERLGDSLEFRVRVDRAGDVHVVKQLGQDWFVSNVPAETVQAQGAD